MNKKVLGIVILAILICLMIGIKVFTGDAKQNTNNQDISKSENKSITDVTIAVGGGKEDFIADTRVNEIMKVK